jgi:hypothetical protein
MAHRAHRRRSARSTLRTAGLVAIIIRMVSLVRTNERAAGFLAAHAGGGHTRTATRASSACEHRVVLNHHDERSRFSSKEHGVW